MFVFEYLLKCLKVPLWWMTVGIRGKGLVALFSPMKVWVLCKSTFKIYRVRFLRGWKVDWLALAEIILNPQKWENYRRIFPVGRMAGWRDNGVTSALLGENKIKRWAETEREGRRKGQGSVLSTVAILVLQAFVSLTLRHLINLCVILKHSAMLWWLQSHLLTTQCFKCKLFPGVMVN